jgi:hypothetical protein
LVTDGDSLQPPACFNTGSDFLKAGTGLFPLLLNPLFHADAFHLLKSFLLCLVENVRMLPLLISVIAWKICTFKTEINALLSAAFADRTAGPATAAIAVKGARTL